MFVIMQPAVKSESEPNDGVCEDGEGWGCIAEIASKIIFIFTNNHHDHCHHFIIIFVIIPIFIFIFIASSSMQPSSLSLWVIFEIKMTQIS